MAIEKTLDELPESRAKVLKEWILDGSEYAEYQLSHKKLFFLKIDRIALKDNIRGENSSR